MKTEHIKEFLLLSEMMNYSVTADKLFISQPTLSRHIKTMEEELGYQLIKTSSHGIELTDIGRKAIRPFRKIVHEYDNFCLQCKNYAKDISGSLRLGLLYYAIDDYMGDFITYFKNKYQNIDLICESGLPQTIYNALNNDKLDIGSLFYLSDKISDDFICRKITEQKLIAVMSDKHPLHAKESVTLEELTAFPLVDLKQDRYSQDLTHAILAANNICFRHSYLTDNIEMVPLAVRSSGGIHITGNICRKQNAASVVYIPIKNRAPVLSFGFAARKNNNSALVSLFLDEVKNYYS